jgi:hypothetical protein
MLEVMIELSVAAEHDAELAYQAEMTDLLRTSLGEGFSTVAPHAADEGNFDD